MSFVVKELVNLNEVTFGRLVSKHCHLQGWIKSTRDSKNILFVDFTDGSTYQNLQLIIKKSALIDNISPSELKKLAIQTAIDVTGTLQLNAKTKLAELVVHDLKILSMTDHNYILQKKEHSLNYLRSIAHLRPQTKLFHALFAFRNKIFHFIHSYFLKNHFINITAPVLTANDAEGAGEIFEITGSKEFFSKKTFLSVSGQLGSEAFALAFKKVYTFGPIFRAEKSHTLRHMAEFYMIEPEVAFSDLEEIVTLAYDILTSTIKYTLDECVDLVEIFSKYHDFDIISYLTKLLNQPPVVLEYYDAWEKINHYLSKNPQLEIPLLNDGDDFMLVHERLLVDNIIKGFVTVTHYPFDHKPFYMKIRAADNTVYCFDLLVPQVGELFGGSQRCDDYDELIKNFTIKHPHSKHQALQWYFDLRKAGYYQSAGFGLGFERLIMLLTKFNNIQDVIGFPRQAGYIDY